MPKHGRSSRHGRRHKRSTGSKSTGALTQSSRVSVSVGHGLRHTLHDAWRLLQSQMQFMYLRFQGVNDFESLQNQVYNQDLNASWNNPNPAAGTSSVITPAYNLAATSGTNLYAAQGATNLFIYRNGYYPMNNTYTINSLSASTLSCPLYMFDLSSGTNTIPGAAAPFSKMIISYATAATVPVNPQAITFSAVPGQTTIGSTTSNLWQYESTPAGSGSNGNQPFRRDYWDYSNIRLLLYGARSTSITYTISLVQFKKDYLCPDQMQNLLAGPDSNNQTAFWSRQVQELLYSPVQMRYQTGGPDDMKVIKSWKYTLSPKTTIEMDNAPHNKLVSIFYRANRIRKWDWDFITDNPGGNLVGAAGIEGAGFEQSFAQQNANTVAPRARVYLMVKANAYVADNTNGSAFRADVEGSFDLCIRNKSIFIE